MTSTGIKTRTLKAKNNRIAARLSDEEYNFLIEYAMQKGISVSNAMRHAIKSLMQNQDK